jgi:transposase-like protein
MRRRFTAEERQGFVDDVRAGASVREAAARIGLNTSIGYRWMQAAAKLGAPRFARVVPGAEARRSSAAVVVRVGAATVHVEPGFDADLLRAVISALSTESK